MNTPTGAKIQGKVFELTNLGNIDMNILNFCFHKYCKDRFTFNNWSALDASAAQAAIGLVGNPSNCDSITRAPPLPIFYREILVERKEQ